MATSSTSPSLDKITGQPSDTDRDEATGTESPQTSPSVGDEEKQVGDREAVQDESTSRDQERSIRGFRWLLVCLAVFSANLLYGLDTTITADIQASVSDTFDDISLLGWLGFGFGLGSSVIILPTGKAFAIFDVKWLFVTAVTMFAAGSALCGGAPSMGALVFGRIWAGAGGAGMYLGTLNLFAALAPPKERSLYFSLEGFIFGAGSILGPIIGGLFSDSSATWRWAFYINIVIFAVASPLFLFALPSIPRRPDVSFLDKLKMFDWLGIVLNTGMYVCFVLAFGFGGAIWPWNDGRFIAVIVLFVVFAVSFVVTQRYAVLTTKANRLFPCEFLADLQLNLLFGCMAFGSIAQFVSIYYIPFFFLFTRGESGTSAAVRLLPFIAFYVAAILSCGYALPRIGYHWLWFFISALLLTAGGVAMYTVDASSPVAYTYGFSLLLGLGLASTQCGYYVAGNHVGPARGAEAIQFLNVAQGSGQMLGLLLASTLFQNEAFRGVKEVLRGLSYSEEQIRGAIGGTRSPILEAMAPELRQRCLDAIVRTIQKEWIFVLTVGAAMVICAMFLSKSRF